MIEPKAQSYEDFPASPLFREGMITQSREQYSAIHLQQHTYDPEENLHFLYITTGKKAPLILYVQGSAWMKQDLYGHVFDLYEFAKRGFNIAIVEYRDTSRAPFPAQVKDAKRALHYIHEHAEELKADMDQVLLWGDSSGGHTVLMMWATHNRLFQDFTLPEIRGVIDFYGPTHIATMNEVPSTQDHRTPESPEGRLIGFLPVLEHPELADRTIVMNYIEADTDLKPLVIFHGTKDRLVPFAQSVELYDHLQQLGKDVTFYRLDQADHGGEYFWHERTLERVYEFAKGVCELPE